MQHARLVVVQTCSNGPEADLTKNTLEAAGIQAMIQADTAGRMREHLAWSGEGFKILVREEDAAAARDVLTPPSGTLVNDSGEGIDADFQADCDTPPTWRRFT